MALYASVPSGLGRSNEERQGTMPKRKSFTAMSPEGICEIIDRMRQSGEAYRITFNHLDFWNFLIALRHLHDDPDTSPDLQEWAASFVSGIGETFDVEMI